MDTQRAKIRWSAVALIALATLLGACTVERTSGLTSAADNSCLFQAEPTPTPADATPTPSPTSTPRPTPTTPGDPTPTPTATPAPMVEPSTLSVPDSVASWSDAIVIVGQPTDSGGMRTSAGLVVREDGAVLTVFRLPPRSSSFQVAIGERTLPATIEAFDPLTGAALLTVDAGGLATVPLDTQKVSNLGERALAFWRESGTGELIVEGMTAGPDRLSPDAFFALRRYTRARIPRMGSLIVALDGTPLGLAGASGKWSGTSIHFGGGLAPVYTHAAVQLSSALTLLDGERPNAGPIPGAVVYHGQGQFRITDNPATRAAVADPVTHELSQLGRPIDADWLGARPPYTAGMESGAVLEMLYFEPRELHNAEGELLGTGRYIAFWWARGDGKPDLVLCGRDEEHVGAAFATSGLDRFEPLMEEQPATGRSIVDPVEPALEGGASLRLYESYADDRDRADLRFRHAPFETWGEVISATEGQGTTTLRLEGGGSGDVRCSYHTWDTPAIHPGERVAVRGYIAGRARTEEGFDVVIDRCELAETSEGRLLGDGPRAIIGPSSGPGPASP